MKRLPSHRARYYCIFLLIGVLGLVSPGFSQSERATYVRSLIDQGVGNMKVGVLDKATTDFSVAEDLADPDSLYKDEAKFNLIKSLSKMGKDDDLAREYQDFVTNRPNSKSRDDLDFFLATHHFEKKGDPKTAQGFVKHLLDNYPDSPYYPQALFYGMRVSEKLKDFPTVDAYFSKMTTQFPNHALMPTVLYRYGDSLRFVKKDYKKSLSYFQRVVKEYPQHSLVPQALEEMGKIYLFDLPKEEPNARYAELASVLDQCITQYPDTKWAASARLLKVTAQAETYQWKSAVNECNDALAKYGSDTQYNEQMARVTYMAGFCYEQQQDWDEAINAFQKTIDKYSEDTITADAQRELARCYYFQGNISMAYQATLKIIDQYPDTLAAAQAKQSLTHLQQLLAADTVATAAKETAQVKAPVFPAANLCGPVALQYVLTCHGIPADIPELMETSDYNGKGTNFAGLAEAARKKGLQAEGYQLKYSTLAKLDFPLIVQLKEKGNEHFVAITHMDNGKVYYYDQKGPHQVYSFKEFKRLWSGYALAIHGGDTNLPNAQMAKADSKLLNLEEMESISGGYQALAAQSDHTQMCGNGNGEGEDGYKEPGARGGDTSPFIRPQRPSGHASTGMFANGGKGKGGRVLEQLGVNLGRGNTYTGFTTVSIPVQGGLTIDMCHYYQSNWHFSPYTQWDNPWGRSWHINHDMMLTFMSVNTVLFFKESGNFVPLAKSGNGIYYTINNKDLGYTFPEKVKMTEGGSGKPFLLENRSGRLYAFDTLFSSQTANIIWYSNYAGATVRYYYGMSASYPNTYGKVTAVLDNNGHGLFMQYSLPVGDFAYRLTSVKDHTGRIYYYAYDNLVYGALKRITYPDGYYVEYGYDTTSVVNASWAEITSTRDATSGDTILYKYEYSDFLYPNGDPGRRLARVTDMNGNTAEYAFDEWWYYTTVTLKDNAGTVMRTASVQYDVGQHAALRTDWSDGNHEYYTWDGILNPTSVTDRLGQAYNYGYDSLSNMTSMQKPNGDMQYWYYDTSNWYSLMTSSTDSLGNGTYYGYDAARRLLTWEKDPMGNVTQFTYDSYGNQITATDPLGNVTQYAYNQYGQKSMMITADKATTSYLYDALGNQTTVIDPLGNRTDYSYDLRNRVIQIQNAQGSKTQFQYALNDLLKKKTDANGNQTIYSYDLRGRLIQETDAGNRSIQYMYDRFDNLTCKIDARGYQSSYFYDSLSRLTARRYYNGTTALYYYDALDRMTAVYDPCLGWSYMSYDALGRMTGNVTPAGSFNYSYDAQGNRTGVKNADGSLSGFYYNAAGKQYLAQNYVTGKWFWNSFDKKGRKLQSIYPDGIITQYQYNVVDRVTDMNLLKPTDAFNRSDNSSIGSSWSEVAGDWSIQGNQLYINNGSGINLLVNSSYGYLSNPVMEATFTCHTAYGAQNGLFVFGYNGASNYYYAGIAVNGTPSLVIGQCLNGNLTNLASVNCTAYAEYPVRMRLTVSDSSVKLSVLETGVWKDYLTFEGGVRIPSGWVGLSSFYSQTHFDDLIINNNTSTFATYHYDYDLAGNRIDQVETGSKRTYYTYDGLNQLTREYRPYSPVTYDKYYQYDKVGNRTSTVINGTATAYSYDCMNQLSASTSGSTVFCFNYDANGNLLQRGPTPQENYTWNEDNHLTQYHFGTAPYSAYYTYDVFGRLAKRNYVSTENKYLYDQMSNNILMEKSGSSVANAYILNDQPVGQVYSSTKYGTEYFYHYDPAGTLLLMTSASGDTVSAYIHDSFGNMVYSYGSLFYDAHMYGQPLDSLGGFYIMGGRSFFEPELGVFLNKKETPLRGADYILNEHNPFSAIVPQEILD